MGKKNFCVLLLCVVLCAVLLAGCSDDSIVGTWESKGTKGVDWVFHEDGTMDIIRKGGDDQIGQNIYEIRGDEIWTFSIDENGEKIEDSYINFEKKGKKMYMNDKVSLEKKW